MSHNYLLDLRQYIDNRIVAVKTDLRSAPASEAGRRRLCGRLDALESFQALLCREYYPKLPQRLYRRLYAKACRGNPPATGDREHGNCRSG